MPEREDSDINEIVKSFLTDKEYKEIEKLLLNPLTYESVDISNTQQPTDDLGILMYQLVNTWTSPLAKRLLTQKSKVDGYDYYDMIKMYVDTVKSLDDKHRNYILLRAIEAACAEQPDRVMSTLTQSLNLKEASIIATLDILRLVFPYFITSCKEYYNGFRTNNRFDRYIENYLKAHKLAIEKRLKEIDRFLERTQSVTESDVRDAVSKQIVQDGEGDRQESIAGDVGQV